MARACGGTRSAGSRRSGPAAPAARSGTVRPKAMAKAPPTTQPHIERPGPAEFRDPLVRREMVKAAVWFGMAIAIVGVIVLGQPLLLIVGGAIFAVFLDGGTRLLGHFLPIPRAWRLLLVLILGCCSGGSSA